MKCRPCDQPMPLADGRYTCPACRRSEQRWDAAFTAPVSATVAPPQEWEAPEMEAPVVVYEAPVRSPFAPTFPDRECARCPESFTPKAGNQRYCSPCAREVGRLAEATRAINAATRRRAELAAKATNRQRVAA